MVKRLTLLTVALVAIVLFAIGCAYQPAVPPTPIPTLAPATMPPAPPTQPAASGEGTPSPASEGGTSGAADLVTAGGQVFEQNCSVCHNLTAETKVGPGLAGLFGRQQLPNGNPVNEENLKEWIVTGGGAMPGLPLTAEQLAAVVAFLQDATQ
jgi:mono/diheme cytochrome c family protein